MMCVFCQKQGIREVQTDYNQNIKGIKIIVQNVPALYCETCGDYYFKNSDIKLIRNYVESLDRKEENLLVFDYNKILDCH